MDTRRTFTVIFIICFFASVPLFGGMTEFSAKLQGSGINTAYGLYVEDDQYAYMTTSPGSGLWPSEFSNYKINNRVRLRYLESTRVHHTSSWTVVVGCELEKWDETGTLITPNETFTLTVTYNPVAGTTYNDLDQYTANFPGHRTRLTITSVTGAVPADLMLESVVEVERYYYYDWTAAPDIAHQYNSSNNTLTFYWDYLPGAEEYDVEWTFVSAYDAVQTPDYSRARRVTLNAQNYTINLPFDDGKIYYRVRGAGKHGTDWDLRLDGAWGTCVSAYTVGNSDAEHNWTYNAVYAEDGKRKEVMSFFDGSLRQRQAVTLNNSDNVAMQMETFYDYEGRNVVQTLAAPDASFGSQLKFYTLQSVSTASSQQYSRRDYDRDALYASCTMDAPSAMSTSSGASRYYSSSNSKVAIGFHAALPDAQEFPFAQVAYDREGRVKKQTGAGEDFNMASGHTMEYFYANPSQERLDRLFGCEAGYASHYNLSASQDANGQVSLSYIDMHGRIVATSLAGEAPDAMDDIAGNSNQPFTQDFSTLNYYDQAEEVWIVNTNFLVTNPNTNYVFNYTVTPEEYSAACASVEGDCEYDLIISIYDDCDAVMSNTGTLVLHTTYVITASNLSYTFTVQFPKVGTYRIEKKLKLNQAAFDAALAAFMAGLPGTCITPQSTLSADLLGQYTFDCNDCVTWCEQQADEQELTGEARDEFIAECVAENCGNIITEGEMNCDVLLDVLKDDMSPGGQYADFSALGWMYSNLENTPSPYATGFSWGGFDTYVVTVCGLPDPNLTSWAAVASTWVDCYADYLVQFHPEYCHYQWCVQMQPSTLYDIQMFGDGINDANTLYWAENTNIPSTSVPYIDQTQTFVGQNIIDNDPFFNTSPGSTYEPAMQDELEDYATLSPSMWDYAQTLTPYAYPTDDQWFAFRAIYLEKKMQFVRLAREAAACYSLVDNDSPPNTIADASTCDYVFTNPPGCNPPGTAGFIIRWPDYTYNFETVNTTGEVDDMANDFNTTYQPCKTPATIELEMPDDDFDFDPADCIDLRVSDGITDVDIMAAPLCGMGSIDGATLVQMLVQAINTFVSVPDYTAVINPSDPFKFTIYAPASLGATPNGDYYVEIDQPLFLNLDVLAPEKFANGSDEGECPQNKHCLCAQIDQAIEMYNATYVDPVDHLTYYYIDHVACTTAAQYVKNVFYALDNTVTQAMVDNWIANCTASDGQDPVDDEESETYQPLTIATDCATPDEDCDQDAPELTDFWGTFLYEQGVAQAVNNFINDYKAQCFGGDFGEVFTVTYQEREYHYTLYYYDQAGNLTRTVPPAAVQPLALATTYGSHTIGAEINDYRNGVGGASFIVPNHARSTNTLVTNYKYTTLNRVIENTSPDGGATTSFYDRVGRIVATQNAKQAAASGGGVYWCTYMLYDARNRVIESGQVMTSVDLTTGIAADYAAFVTWVAGGSNEQVTNTYYDETISGTIDALFDNGQEFLRNRVASITYQRDMSSATYDHASHYSYDVHGNVKQLIQEMPELVDLDLQYQFINYKYDLVSGNVNEVHYQSPASSSRADQFHHRYFYDADNRLTNVYTSTDNIIWDQDAKYLYYLHGPLARTELGEVKVQGSDYAYTINGWLKGVNSSVLDETKDLGKDGTSPSNFSYSVTRIGLHSNIGRDASGYVLGYYWNTTSGDLDWRPINAAAQSLYYNVTSLTDATGDLFNGNIKEMATALMQPNALANPSKIPLIFNRYHYDQLDRIVSASSFTHASNTSTYASHADNDEFKNEFTYDPNGNILTQDRNGNLTSGLSMDNLTYHYIAGTNQLEYVDDGGSTTNYSDDFKAQSAANYDYTQIGELKADAIEQIDEIIWDVNGKIHSIERSPTSTKSDLEFKYDAMGNRVCKIVKPRSGSGLMDESFWTYTYYVRDAQGNVMGVYGRDKNASGASYTDELSFQEADMYGGARLGMRQYRSNNYTASATYAFSGYNGDGTFIPGALTLQLPMAAPDPASQTRTLGLKLFELANHLGNVLVAVTDRKVSVDGNADNLTDYYLSDVISTNDYSAFGAPMPGRQYSSSSYRYGFNGKENDPESVGTGEGLQDYGFRIYNPSLGKFLSVDPLTANYPQWTPYQFAGNMPIRYIDLDGLEPAEPGTNVGDYEIAKARGGDELFGWTWTKMEDSENFFWKQGASTDFQSGDITSPNAKDGDQEMNKNPIPGVIVASVGYNSETLHKMIFANAFAQGISLESKEAQKEAQLLITSFFTGKGGAGYSFPQGREMSRLLSEDAGFKKVADAFEASAMAYYKENGTLEGFKPVLTRPYVKDTWFMHTVLGGTQQINAQIQSISADHIVVNYTVWDRFAAGKSDAASKLPGLPSMYWLQHNSGIPDKYVPFIWNIKTTRKK